MRLLLIRHGETVDNVAGIYAGVRDSPLTTHGVLQASRLASHLATGFKISHIYSSDLQRAFKTAESVRLAQPTPPSETLKLEVLREQDFGYYEGKTFLERQKGSDKSGKDIHRTIHAQEEGFQDVESKESMRLRADTFVDLHLEEHLRSRLDEEIVVVVSHGIILSHLWRAILGRFQGRNISLGSGVVMRDGRGLEYLGGWSNTGVLDLEIKTVSKPNSEPIPALEADAAVVIDLVPLTTTRPPHEAGHSDSILEIPTASVPRTAAPSLNAPTVSTTAKLPSLSLVVKAVNSQAHLRGLKKTRGGIGSAQHDEKQKTVDSFFKKRKLE